MRSGNRKAAVLVYVRDAGDASDFFDDAGEHGGPQISNSDWAFARELLESRVRIFQVSRNRKIFAKPVQADVRYDRRAGKTGKSDSCGEWDARASEHLRGEVEKNLVRNAGGERSRVNHRAAFNHEAGNLHFAEATNRSSKVWAAIGGCLGYLPYANAFFLQLSFLR